VTNCNDTLTHQEGIYEKIVFRGQDIKDLNVLSSSSMQSAPDGGLGSSSMHRSVTPDAFSTSMPKQSPQQQLSSPWTNQVRAAHGGPMQMASREAHNSRSATSIPIVRDSSRQSSPRGTGRGMSGAGHRGEGVGRILAPDVGKETSS
jgi:hypothetical protein